MNPPLPRLLPPRKSTRAQTELRSRGYFAFSSTAMQEDKDHPSPRNCQPLSGQAGIPPSGRGPRQIRPKPLAGPHNRAPLSPTTKRTRRMQEARGAISRRVALSGESRDYQLDARALEKLGAKA